MRGLTRTGPRDAPTILFLHGGVINRHMWRPVTACLDDRYDCVAIDLAGHGERADVPFTIETSVDLVTRALDESSTEQATLVGLSLGGYVAQAFAASHPERVTGLVLSGATIRYTGWDGISTRLYGTIFPMVTRPAKKAFAKRIREDLGDEIAMPILAGGLSMKGGAQALRRLPGTDHAALMTGYEGPIALANGERDADNREAERLFLQHHPKAESVIIEDAGHACALQQPAAFAGVVDRVVVSTT